MTTYRLWPATNGGALAAFAGNFIGATNIAVYGGGNWLNGYYIWCPAGGDTAPSGGYKAALWSISSGVGGGTGRLVPGSAASLATVTANAWNFIALASPVPLSPGWNKPATQSGSQYLACVGWVAVNGFADTNNYWDGAGAGTNGITNGPLIGYSATTGTSNKPPFATNGVFSTAGSDPSVTLPQQTSGTDNFWVDVQISDTAPGGYNGSYSVWPNKFDSNNFTVGDLNVNYTIATEVSLSQYCILNSIRYFSPSGATTLATRASVWSVSGAAEVATIASPSWVAVSTGSAFTAGTTPDGGAGTWIKAVFPGGVTLNAGDYRVSIFNSNGTSDANWSAKDASTDYWGQTATTSVGAAGITSGPITAPGYSTAASGFIYSPTTPGSTPPYNSGSSAHAQSVFGQNPGGTVQFPQLYAPVGGGSNQAQNYWVDLEVTPSAAPSQPAFAYTTHWV